MDKTLYKTVSDYVDQNRETIISELFELCRIPSVKGAKECGMPFGKYPDEALRKSCEIAERYGIKTDIKREKGYAVCSLGDGEKSIAVLAHADVVAAGEGWTRTSAFEPLEKDGWLYGRGVLDDKCGVITGIYVQRAAKELSLPIKSQLLTVVGICEETHMPDIKAYAAENKNPDFCLVADSGFPVCYCEKSSNDITIISKKPFESIKEISGGTARNAVAAKASARISFTPELKAALESACADDPDLTLEHRGCELILTAVGLTAHASKPQGSKNAVLTLCRALYMCPEISPNDRIILESAVKATGDYYGEGFGISSEHPETGKLTSVCGLASTDDERLKLSFNVRFGKESTREMAENGFKSFCEAEGWDIAECLHSEGYYIDPSEPFVTALMDTYKEITGIKDSKPYIMRGGTYARHLKNALPFGLRLETALPDLPAGHGSWHQPDETIRAESFLKAIKIYILAAVELDKILNK